MIEITIQSDRVQAALRHMAEGVQDMTPAMARVAKMLETETDFNFSHEGRPKWLGLKPSTIKRRGKKGYWPGMILQQTGALAGSITTGHDATSATIGVGKNIKYGAIHQFGGQAGRGRKVKIEPRPFLPIDSNGNLQPEAEESILDVVNSYLSSLIK